MKKTITALRFFLGSILYAVIWIRIFYFSYNYRLEDDAFYVLILFPLMFIVFFSLGLYINAIIFRFCSRRERDIAPSALLKSYIIIFVISIIIVAVFGVDVFRIDFWSLGIILFLPLLGLKIASHSQNNKNVKYFGKKISSALLINLFFLMVVCINDFPGVNAPIEARQKWAYKELNGYTDAYSTIVNSIKEADQITDKVGQVKFVAPTKGRNLFFRIGAGNMVTSDLTLEVVGKKGTGIANITTIGGGIQAISFEYQGKKTKLTSWGSGILGRARVGWASAIPDSDIAKPKPKPKPISGINVAAGKPVVARAGGVTYPDWSNANDLVDYKTTTNYPKLGRWGNKTNAEQGTFQVVDLGAVYSLNGVGYNIDWNGDFKNPLTFRVEVSTDNKTWRLVSEIVHPYSATSGSNKLDINVEIKLMDARYVQYWEPPDREWNGWGTFHQLRAYSPKK
jgi:hypothetical protein